MSDPLRVVIADDEAPARAKLRRLLSTEPGIEVVGEAGDGLTALSLLESLRPELALLDIQMPLLSGLEVAAQLADPPLLVFVTAHDAHAIKAFELNALDYLLKPYARERLAASLARARQRLGEGSAPRRDALAAAQRELAGPAGGGRLLVRVAEGYRVLDCATLSHLRSDDNYVQLHGEEGPLTLRGSLGHWLSRLPADFVQVHRTCAVNLAWVRAVEPLFKGDAELVLRDGTRLPLSRRYRESFFARFAPV